LKLAAIIVGLLHSVECIEEGKSYTFENVNFPGFFLQVYPNSAPNITRSKSENSKFNLIKVSEREWKIKNIAHGHFLEITNKK
jgi:hypothetical protein